MQITYLVVEMEVKSEVIYSLWKVSRERGNKDNVKCSIFKRRYVARRSLKNTKICFLYLDIRGRMRHASLYGNVIFWSKFFRRLVSVFCRV